MKPFRIPRLQWSRILKWAYFLLPFLFLMGAMWSTMWPANIAFSNIQDATVYPFLFKHFNLHDIILPGNHPNILKFPLFILQAHLPYTFTSYSLVNMVLVIISVGAWCVLLTKILGRKYFPIIALLLACTFSVSYAFSINFVETTIRNIEYPVGLAFMMVIADILKETVKNKKRIALYTVITLLFAAALASDSLLQYSFCIPPLVLLVIYWIKFGKVTQRVVIAFLTVVGTALLGIAIRKTIAVLGIASYYFSPTFKPKVLPVDQFGPSLAHALRQYFQLTGGDFFNLYIHGSTLLVFFNALMSLLGLMGLWLLVRNALHKSTLEDSELFIGNNFVLSSLALSFFVTFGIYVFSGQVLKPQNGILVDASQIRYITLLALLYVVGVVYLVDHYYKSRTDIRLALATISACLLLLFIPLARTQYNTTIASELVKRQSIFNIITAAKANNVHYIVTGDTTGAPIEFWSKGDIRYASFLDCGRGFRMSHNTRASWFTGPINLSLSGTSPMALVIDRTGLDLPYSQDCSPQAITNMYGKPVKILFVKNPAGTEYTEMWLYAHDIRKVLKPAPKSFVF